MARRPFACGGEGYGPIFDPPLNSIVPPGEIEGGDSINPDRARALETSGDGADDGLAPADRDWPEPEQQNKRERQSGGKNEEKGAGRINPQET